MPHEIMLFRFKHNSSQSNFKIEVVNKCPHCFSSIKPHMVLKTDYDEKLKMPVAVLYQCPSCQSFFVNAYSVCDRMDNSISGYTTDLIPYSYKQLAKYDLPEELEKVSVTFKEIYMQTLTAEAEGLLQITGIGYRKSIEFLIKDFLIHNQQEDAEKIAKIPLSQAIDRLESNKVKDLAKASVWLGNDETHYLKKYQDKDINDMKRFIRALSFFISSELTASEAQDFINQ
ncbi:MAG TPA: DUF4145 domain-containing protein [Patescibacteria group bacterium]|nr:DUF4145 domain-containing protein [Patescibacteria group bacterium]